MGGGSGHERDRARKGLIRQEALEVMREKKVNGGESRGQTDRAPTSTTPHPRGGSGVTGGTLGKQGAPTVPNWPLSSPRSCTRVPW